MHSQVFSIKQVVKYSKIDGSKNLRRSPSLNMIWYPDTQNCRILSSSLSPVPSVHLLRAYLGILLHVVLGDVLSRVDELEEVEHGVDSKDDVEVVPFLDKGALRKNKSKKQTKKLFLDSIPSKPITPNK